jgi:Rad3-related DNA helicase/DNA polymerase III epsilon subunit-like protein
VSAGPERPESFVAFDLEATGLSAKADRPLEIGAVRYDSSLRRVAEMELIVDPGMPIPLAVQRLVGLRAADVEGRPSPEEGMAELADFCEDSALITHGGAFDLALCRAYLPEQFGRRLVFDTLELARILMPTLASHSLPLLTGLLSLEHERPHRALSDAAATGALFTHLVVLAGRLPRATLGEIRRVAGQTQGPLAEFFLRVVEAAPAAGPAERQPAAAPVTDLPPLPAAAGAMDGLSVEEASARLLGPGGALSATTGYEYREGQVEMARAVAQTLERGRRLLVEAGTGSGKSLAYTVPLAIWALRRRERAVIATRTITLQEQLAGRDLPVTAALLGTPLRTALLKGRSHYVSLRRWERWLGAPDTGPHGPDLDAVRFKLKVLVWLTATTTGDRGELHLATAEEQLWRHIESDADDCLGRECANWQSGRCHMVAARQSAAEAALVVTNHAVLLADAERQGQVLAPYSALVVDEAHHLEASATQQLGSVTTAADLSLILERVPGATAGLAQLVSACREAGHRLFGDAKGFLVERLGGEGNGTVALTPEVREDPRFQPLLRSARHAVGVLLRASSALEEAGSGEQPQAALIGDAGEAEELSLAADALAGLARAVERVVCRPVADRVAWLALQSEQAGLHDAPVSVAEALRERVFDRTGATVLTSATLAVGGAFDFVRARVGIGGGADELALPSPFDYLAQALCVLATDVPPYDDPGHDQVLAALVHDTALRLGGRTLVLFTGYGPLKRVHQLIGSRLDAAGISLLGQGLDGTRRQILRSFVADQRSVLLGTSSFWEGVDVPGDALRCVVIDKLPFAVPTDPLVRAHTEGLSDPFGQYILPLAVLRLKQGFGRLIRSRRDRGAVVLCDPRLDSREYGARFLAALPPAAVVREASAAVPGTVQRFVESADEALAGSTESSPPRWW